MSVSKTCDRCGLVTDRPEWQEICNCALHDEIERLQRRWKQITGDPEGSRNLLRLLMIGRGSLDDFNTMIDRAIKSAEVVDGNV